jgi:hypothetical protein
VIAKSINKNPAASKQLNIAEYVFLDAVHRPQIQATPANSLFNRSGLAQAPLDDWLSMLETAQTARC